MMKYPIGFKGPANQLQQFISEPQAYKAGSKIVNNQMESWRFFKESSMAEAIFSESKSEVKTIIHWPPEEDLGNCTCKKSQCWHLHATLLETKSRIDQLPPFIQQVQLSKIPQQAFAVWLNQQNFDPYPQMAKHRLLYVLKKSEETGQVTLGLHKGYISKEDKYSIKSELETSLIYQKPLPKFVTLLDSEILYKLNQKGFKDLHEITLSEVKDEELIESIIESKRCFWRSVYRQPLQLEEGQLRNNQDGVYQISKRMTLSTLENLIYRTPHQKEPTKKLIIKNLSEVKAKATIRTKTINFHLNQLNKFEVDYLELSFVYQNNEFNFNDLSEDSVQLTQKLLDLLFGFHHQLDRLNSVMAHYEHPVCKHFHVSSRYLEKDFITYLPLLRALQREGWIVKIDPNFRLNQKTINQAYFELNTNQMESWFELELGVTIDGEPVNLVPWLKKSVRSNNIEELQFDSIEVKKGQVIQLDEKLQNQIKQIVMNLIPNDKSLNKSSIHLNKQQFLELTQIQNKDNQDSVEWKLSDQVQSSIDHLIKSYETKHIATPTNLKAELRDYQNEGVAWMQFLRKNHFGGILADDMGLGKTLQTLTHILIEKNSQRKKLPSLIVVPTSLIGNWQNEIEKFTPELSSMILRGSQRFENYENISNFDIVIISYGILVRDIEILETIEFYFQILDEAQAIKNARTQKAKSVRRIQSQHKLCLTGTPIENHLSEIWSQFHYLMPGFLASQNHFNQTFRNPIEKQGSTEKIELLSQRISPFMLRRTKNKVAKELPDKTEIIQWIEMPEEQKNTYETIRLLVTDEIKTALNSQQQNQFAVTNALLRLRQVCCHPALVDEKLISQDSSKMNWIQTSLPQMIEEGRRVLIFSSFRKMLDLLSKQLNKLDLDHHLLTGQTPSEKRTRQVESFQNHDVPVFLISLKAGGTGLNLTAADTVIHFDPWWNPAAENQASDRAHRLGQDKNVFVYKLICRGTVEEKIHQMQKNKQKLADDFLEKKNQNSNFTQNQWEELLKPI